MSDQADEDEDEERVGVENKVDQESNQESDQESDQKLDHKLDNDSNMTLLRAMSLLCAVVRLYQNMTLHLPISCLFHGHLALCSSPIGFKKTCDSYKVQGVQPPSGPITCLGCNG